MVRELLCYHGTSLANAKKITTSKAYKHGTKRNDHWLGYGAYFFEEDSEQANFWSRNRYRTEATATLETVVSANRNLMLNLNTRQGIQKLKNYIANLEESGMEIEHDGEMPTRPKVANMVFSSISKDELWVIMRNFHVASKYDEDVSVRKLSFSHKEKMVDFSLLSPQVCVKNLRAIQPKSIKIVCQAQPTDSGKKRARVKKGSLSYDLFNKQR